MPRPVLRRYGPYLKLLREIALDLQQPVPLRLRAAELALAIRSGEWTVASSRASQRAVRAMTAQDNIDGQLLSAAPIACEETAQSPEPPSPEKSVDDLIAQAESQRKQRRKLEALRGIVADASLSPELRAAAREQLHVLGEPDEAVEPPDRPVEEDPEAEIKRIFAEISSRPRPAEDILTERQAAERQEAEDRDMHVCGQCYLLQAAGNSVCELCGASPEWLLPSFVKDSRELSMFMDLAASWDTERLRTALRSGWASVDMTGTRERVARRVLVARQGEQAKAEAEERERTRAQEPAPPREIDVDAVRRFYQLQLADYDRQLAELAKRKEDKEN